MSLHVIVGAGAVGSGTARRLAEAGHDVRLVTRSGSGPDHPAIERVAADASDAARLTELTTDAHSLYNCANPPYHQWATAWPPLGAAFLAAAEATGARLVTMSNLYGFAAGASPMRATDPLAPGSRKGRIRTDMWHDALRAHDAGRIRATEVRASDYVGPGLGETSHLGDRVVPRVLAGRRVSLLGPADVIHSWSYIGDVCQTLATLGTDDRSLGRAWHVPTLPAVTARTMIDAMADAAGLPHVGVGRIPRPALRVAGLVSPVIRELWEMRYQFDAPFVIDAADTTAVFGLEPTPLDRQIAETLDAYRNPAVAP
ncbi:MAG: NAD-dependent epimerase/dehydratase family protein [Acidimicrobiales bacterium]